MCCPDCTAPSPVNLKVQEGVKMIHAGFRGLDNWGVTSLLRPLAVLGWSRWKRGTHYSAHLDPSHSEVFFFE